MSHAPIIGSKPLQGKQERAIWLQIEYHHTMSEHQPPKNDSPHLADVRKPVVMLSDLTSELLWPKILRAPALALAPSRLVSGFVCAFLLSLVLEIASRITFFTDEFQVINDSFSNLGRGFSESIFNLDPLWFLGNVWIFAQAVRDMVFHHPLVAVLVGIPLIAIATIAGGAISRSTAIEFAQGRFASRQDTLIFALRRTRQLVGAVLGPVVLIAALLLLIALGGLLLSVPVLDVLGSLLYAIGLLVGIVATVVLLLHVLALPMIVPALAVEGTDGFDAVQRSYAYVIARPLRYLSYALILFAVGIIAVAVFTMVARGSIEMTDWAASLSANDSTARTLTGLGEQGATKATAHTIIEIWRTIIELAIAGYVISLFFTSSTLLYLVIRRICDGQDINEIWEGDGK